MRSILAVAVVLLALVGASTAAAADKPPNPTVVCGGCDGSGYNGCATVGDQVADGFGNELGAWYHWCWSNGSVYNNYGWGYANGAPTISFSGYVTDHDFQYGHDTIGRFTAIWSPWWPSTSHRCVWVDGWGNWGICRAWYE